MSPGFILGRENVPCVAGVVNRSLKADCTNYTVVRTSGTESCEGCLKTQFKHSPPQLALKLSLVRLDSFQTSKEFYELRLLFVLATKHTLLRMFLNIWRQIWFPGDLHDDAL